MEKIYLHNDEFVHLNVCLITDSSLTLLSDEISKIKTYDGVKSILSFSTLNLYKVMLFLGEVLQCIIHKSELRRKVLSISLGQISTKAQDSSKKNKIGLKRIIQREYKLDPN